MNTAIIQLPFILDGEDKTSPFINRIRKNYRHARKWAKRTLTDCFRLYDREIPGYPISIDFYANRFCIHYFSPCGSGEEPSSDFTKKVEEALVTIFGVQSEAIYWRVRQKTQQTRQYEKRGEFKEFFIALEYGVKFKINLIDYLDTGLFLDHRETRHRVASLAFGKRLLNLFSYTCAFSVQAAVAGASFTKSVDMSNTYTKWGRENFIINALPTEKNEIIRADCLKFLSNEINKCLIYDIIVIDPPTISRSKKMDQLFDIQADYIELILKSLKLLSPDGVIFFSTNSRKFSFDEEAFKGCRIKEISSQTVPFDFHQKKIHRCWEIRSNLTSCEKEEKL